MLRGYPRYKAFYSLNFNYFHILFVFSKYFFYLCKMEDYSKIFGEGEERELQRLIRKIKWNQPTIEDMKKVLNYIKTKIFKDKKEVVCGNCRDLYSCEM